MIIDEMRKYMLVVMAMLLMTAVTSCKNNKKNQPVQPAVADTDTARETPDSTVYGMALESGMSTIYLLTTNGDTLEMDKEDELGSGDICGYVQEGDSFAVTKRKGTDGGLVVVKAYNLTLLKRFGKDFSVRNGLLVIGGKDTVEVVSIDDDSLICKKKSGGSEIRVAKNK